MTLHGSRSALNDLERIAEYLDAHAPDRSSRLTEALVDAAESLVFLPHRGRPGKLPGTRELILPSLPWIIVYCVRGEGVYLARLLHGAQRWP